MFSCIYYLFFVDTYICSELLPWHVLCSFFFFQFCWLRLFFFVTRIQVHGAWFPPWLAVHVIHYQVFICFLLQYLFSWSIYYILLISLYFQSLLEKYWKVHGKPALELLMQKVGVYLHILSNTIPMVIVLSDI